MLRHGAKLLLTITALSGLSGCCGEPWGGCWPCGKNWCGPQCGPKMWHEWCSLPPCCCDPCDECGCYIGPKLNDSLYSHGNDYGRYAHRQPEPVVAEPAGSSDENPDVPATEPYSPLDTEPYTPGPVPDESPFDSSMRGARGHYDRHASYDPPPSPGSVRSYGTASRTGGRAPYYGPVDSRHASRTLARPPRTRLFSR